MLQRLRRPAPEDATPGSENDDAGVIELRTLGPLYDKRDHKQHVELVLSQLQTQGPAAPRNIALTGHYGSGKSSILGEVERRLSIRRCGQLLPPKIRCLNISLSSLGADVAPVGRVSADGGPSQVTNLIQKEIVKQLLYRRPPNKMRGSRYRRTDKFHPAVTAVWACIAILILLTVALLSGLESRIESTLPESWTVERKWLAWAIVGGLFVLGTLVLWSALKALHNRVWIEKLSAGPAAISLQNTTNSYFDEYLDEIVYFFQASRTSVAIFEDLDRFNDPHIFEALRELNTVLNNSEQVSRKPIRFVYAIKDSIFESVPGTKNSRDSRQPTTNRTKFFDVVIPIVPFITHRSSREFLNQQLGDDHSKLKADLLNLVAPHLTDMRVVKNICNEYRVFASQLLPPAGLEGLDASHLFAMMVYKNLHMSDFEDIRQGVGKLDKLYKEYRSFVDSVARHQEDELRSLQARLDGLEGIPLNASELGERLVGLLQAMAEIDSHGWDPKHTSAEVGTETFKYAQFGSPTFWRAVGGTSERVRVITQWGRRAINRDKLAVLMERDLSAGRWNEDARSQLQSELRAARELREFVAQASLAELVARPDIRIDGEIGLKDILAKHVTDEVVIDLISAGHLLDENYTLYVARFEVGVLSLTAMNFILHVVQPRTPDYRYEFGGAEDIEAVITAEPQRFLYSEAAFNVQVFDHLLGDARLMPALRLLAAEAPHANEFIDTYLGAGQSPSALIGALAPLWPRVFAHLTSLEGWPDATRAMLVDAALATASPQVEYEFGNVERRVVQSALPQCDALTKHGAARDHVALAKVLEQLGLKVQRLSYAEASVRREVIDRGLYPVTEENLIAAVGTGVPLRLASIKKADLAVYEHCVANLPEYLRVAADRNDPTASKLERFVDVIADVAAAWPDLVRDVAARAETGAAVPDLTALEPGTWPDLAATGTFSLTGRNVHEYMKVHGIDQDLATYLSRTGAIEQDDLQPDLVSQLAAEIANSSLDRELRIDLISSLAAEAVDIAMLTRRAADVLPTLVRDGVVADGPQNYALVRASTNDVKLALIDASPGFAGYLDQLQLDGDDLTLLTATPKARDDIRAGVLAGLPRLSQFVEDVAATELTRWALRVAHPLDVPRLELLAQLAAEPASIIAALARDAQSLNAFELTTVLRALKGKYLALVEGGRGYEVRLGENPELRLVLHRLRELGVIQEFRKTGESIKITV